MRGSFDVFLRANPTPLWYKWVMVSIDEMEVMLNELALELPEEFYNELNGGIMLLPQVKQSPAGKGLFIMGQYHRSKGLGRYITIYYGSFEKVYGGLSAARLKNQLRKTLRHEFRHHVESLAGERGLEIEDERTIAEYLRRQRKKDSRNKT
jgi:predicted Zn-dependent protease with MMP-like domain